MPWSFAQTLFTKQTKRCICVWRFFLDHFPWKNSPQQFLDKASRIHEQLCNLAKNYHPTSSVLCLFWSRGKALVQTSKSFSTLQCSWKRSHSKLPWHTRRLWKPIWVELHLGDVVVSPPLPKIIEGGRPCKRDAGRMSNLIIVERYFHDHKGVSATSCTRKSSAECWKNLENFVKKSDGRESQELGTPLEHILKHELKEGVYRRVLVLTDGEVWDTHRIISIAKMLGSMIQNDICISTNMSIQSYAIHRCSIHDLVAWCWKEMDIHWK